MMKVISASKNINDFGEKIDVKINRNTFLTSYLQRLWIPLPGPFVISLT